MKTSAFQSICISFSLSLSQFRHIYQLSLHFSYWRSCDQTIIVIDSMILSRLSRTTNTFVQDSKQILMSHFLSIFLIRFKPMIKQFSHFSYGEIGKRKPNWLNGNSSKSNILWVTFLAASTSSIPPSGSHQDPTTSSLVAEPPNSI